MNNRLLVPRKTPGLLDLVPGAAAAYSLRSLSNSYAGPVVTVRRSSDNAEDSFTASEVADGTLAAFCGAGDGFVKTWHSQTGGVNATQSTASAQPKLVSGGGLITTDGIASMQFDGVDDYLQIAQSNRFIDPTPNCNFGIFIVAKSNNSATNGTTPGAAQSSAPFIYNKQNNFGGVNDRNAFGIHVNSGFVRFTVWDVDPDSSNFYDTVDATLTPVNTAMNVLAFTYVDNSDSLVAAVNGQQVISATLQNKPVDKDQDNIYNIGARVTDVGGAAGFHSMAMAELVIYPSDQSANRELLEGQIAWSYSQ